MLRPSGRTSRVGGKPLRKENYSTTVIVPPPTVPEAEYLEVHFYPDHHVELALVKFPGDRRIPYEEKDE